MVGRSAGGSSAASTTDREAKKNKALSGVEELLKKCRRAMQIWDASVASRRWGLNSRLVTIVSHSSVSGQKKKLRAFPEPAQKLNRSWD